LDQLKQRFTPEEFGLIQYTEKRTNLDRNIAIDRISPLSLASLPITISHNWGKIHNPDAVAMNIENASTLIYFEHSKTL
jgi:hypothetical protein